MSYRDPQSGDLSPFPGAPGGRGRPGGDLSPFPADPRTHASTSGQGAPPRGHAAPSLDAPHSGKTAPYFDVRAHGAENPLSPFQLPPLLNLPLPDTFDKWREEGYLSPPSDQAKCGACYAFAAVGQLSDRISVATRRKQRHELSTQFVVSCLQSKYEYGCGGTLDVPPIYQALMPGGLLGGTYRHFLFPYSGQQWDPKPHKDSKSPCYYDPDAPECSTDDSQKTGALTLPAHCYPPPASAGMTCTGTVPCDIAYIRRWYPDEPKFSFAKVYHLSENTNATHLYPGQAAMEHYQLSIPVAMSPIQFKNNVQRIKEAIYLYGPVTAVIPVYKDFNSKFKPGTAHWSDANYVYEVDKESSNTITGLHHVLLVGWGRDRRGGFWVVKNSWGVWWNYDGYFNARMGDPLLLAESNCHSAIPHDPTTGEVMGAFDHSLGDDGKKDGGGDPPWVVPLIIFVIVLLLAAMILARGALAGADEASPGEAAGYPDRGWRNGELNGRG